MLAFAFCSVYVNKAISCTLLFDRARLVFAGSFFVLLAICYDMAMTSLDIENGDLLVRVEGADKLCALKSHLTIPLAHISDCRYDPESARTWYHGLKLPGTAIPGVITAGTFYKSGQMVFWDVHHTDKTVIIDLHDENYKQLIVEVADPMVAVALITDAIKAL